MLLVKGVALTPVEKIRQSIRHATYPSVLHSNTPTSSSIIPQSLNMQFKFITLTALVLATFAAATPTPLARADGGDGGDGQCSTGEIQCCNTTTTATDPLVSLILGLLGVVVGDVTAIIGINCSPLSVIGIGGGAWYVDFFCRNFQWAKNVAALLTPFAVRTTPLVRITA